MRHVLIVCRLTLLLSPGLFVHTQVGRHFGRHPHRRRDERPARWIRICCGCLRLGGPGCSIGFARRVRSLSDSTTNTRHLLREGQPGARLRPRAARQHRVHRRGLPCDLRHAGGARLRFVGHCGLCVGERGNFHWHRAPRVRRLRYRRPPRARLQREHQPREHRDQFFSCDYRTRRHLFGGRSFAGDLLRARVDRILGTNGGY